MSPRLRDIIAETLKRPVAFHPILARTGGGVSAGLMLSQAFYWSGRTDDANGWFYKTREEWREETCLTRYEQESARKSLKARGLMEEELRGHPARMFYRINFDTLGSAIAQLVENQPTSRRKTSQQVSGKSPNLLVENQPTIKGTEITAETTAEKKTPIYFMETPEWIPIRTWVDFVDMRRKIRRPMTEHAVDLAFRKLAALKAAGSDPAAVLEQSILNSWPGLYPIKENDHGSSNGNRKASGAVAPAVGKYDHRKPDAELAT